MSEAALARSQEQRERDNAARQERLERENKELQTRAAAANTASSSEPTACKQAQQRYNDLMAREAGDSIDAQERSQQALRAMEWACLGPTAAQQLEQQRVLQPNAINRPWSTQRPYGHSQHTHPHGSQPMPSAPSNGASSRQSNDRRTITTPSGSSSRNSVTRESSSAR